ncbi:MAG: hypothetical protein IJ736_14290 [Firmicutes bacterium]|nr:hypothetical protein [Bacillota bacterium]
MSDKNFVSYGDVETVLTEFADSIKTKQDVFKRTVTLTSTGQYSGIRIIYPPFTPETKVANKKITIHSMFGSLELDLSTNVNASPVYGISRVSGVNNIASATVWYKTSSTTNPGQNSIFIQIGTMDTVGHIYTVEIEDDISVLSQYSCSLANGRNATYETTSVTIGRTWSSTDLNNTINSAVATSIGTNSSLVKSTVATYLSANEVYYTGYDGDSCSLVWLALMDTSAYKVYFAIIEQRGSVITKLLEGGSLPGTLTFGFGRPDSDSDRSMTIKYTNDCYIRYGSYISEYM